MRTTIQAIGDQEPVSSDRDKIPYVDAVVLENLRLRTDPLLLPHMAGKTETIGEQYCTFSATILSDKPINAFRGLYGAWRHASYRQRCRNVS